MSILVALRDWDLAAWVARLKREIPDREIVTLGEPFDRRAVDFAVSWKHPPGSLAGLPNLAGLFSLGAGVDHLMSDDRLPDVPIMRVVDPDLTSRMSEYVMLHCLRILRQHDRYARQQRENIWQDDRSQPAAGDVRVGIMGMGVLGQDAARKLRMIGFKVAGWNRSARSLEGVEMHAGAAGMPAFLAQTDILVCLLPLTPDTRGVLNRTLIAGLARDGRTAGPHIINAGRGGLQVEDDILACLDEGLLASATLDVFQTEPLPASSPLWAHPRVTITPHNAAMSDPVTICRQIAEQIRLFERGEPFQNVVDPRRGY